MKEFVDEITESLQANVKLQSLTLCRIGRNGLQSIKEILNNITTLKELNISWGSKGTRFMHNNYNGSSNHEEVVDINILYDGDHKCSSEAITMPNASINDDAVYLITFGLYNNTAVKKLDLSCNRITDDGAVAICDCLKCNNGLKELNLSQNFISSGGMSDLSKYMSQVTYVDLSGNFSSPWDAYCTIIRHSCVTSLTLCGDKGIEYYVENIRDSLQANIAIKLLTLYASATMNVKDNCKRPQNSLVIEGKLNVISDNGKMNNDRVVSIKVLYDNLNECLCETVDLSATVNDDVACLIAFGLHNNTTVKILDLSNNNISDNGAVAISNSLKHNSTINKLDLSQNYIGFKGMSDLSECIKRDTPLKYVDLSGNKSSPWGVYCAVIRHCCVNNLTLCGDEEMKDYVSEIADSLESNAKLQSLTLCKIGRVGVQSIKGVLDDNTTLKELNMSWNYKGTVIKRQLTCDKSISSSSNDHEGVVNSNILYVGDNKCSSEAINISNEDINDDAVYLITFGLYNNKTIRKLDLSCNDITDDGAFVISNCLKYNNTLKELNLSQNHISSRGLSHLSKCIKHITPLEYVDLSGNKSSPWGVYCTVIDHCCLNSLILCGDKGMNEYVKKLTGSLQATTTLRSLTLHNFESHTGMLVVNHLLINNTTLKEFNLSWSNEETKIVCRNLSFNKKRKITLTECPRPLTLFKKNVNDLIVYILCGIYRTTVQKLDISQNRITDDGTVCVSDFLQHSSGLLKELDLSCNQISPRGMNNLSECIQHTIPLEYVDLSGNNSSPWGVYCAIIRHCCVNSLTLCGDEGMEEYVKEIIDSLQTSKTLQSLTLCKIGRTGLQSAKNVLDTNITLKELNLTWKTKGRMIIHRQIMPQNKYNSSNGHEEAVNINILYDSDCKCSSEAINMSNEDINDDAVCLIIFGLHNNTTIKKLDLSCNKITDDGAVAITECLKTNNTIQELNLSYNQITSKGARQIAKVIFANKHLHKLNVSQNSIHDDGVMYISDSLKHNNTLLELNLSSTGITDKAVETIAGAIQANVALQNLDLSQNYISDDGIIVINDCFRNSNTLRELHWL